MGLFLSPAGCSRQMQPEAKWAELTTPGQTFKNRLLLLLFLGREDSLEEGRATQSSVLAWRIPWTDEPGGPQRMGPQRVGHD